MVDGGNDVAECIMTGLIGNLMINIFWRLI